MRQTLRKRLLILFINLCFIALSAKAQDSNKTVSPQPSKPNIATPVKKPVKPAVTIQTPPATTVVNTPEKPDIKVPAKPVDGSLKGQYEDLLKHSWMQQGYKVVNPLRLSALWKNVTDSLKNTNKELATAKQKLNEQAKQISELKKLTGSEGATIADSSATSAQIQVLGMSVDSSTYNWIVWGAIAVLGVSLAAVLFSTARNSNEARHNKELYEEISSEYQSYKTKIDEELKKINAKVIFVGHSLGSCFLLKYLSEEKVDKDIVAMFFIAIPFWGGDHGWQYEGFTLDIEFASKLPANIPIFFYHSTDDEVVPFSHLALYAEKLPHATIRKIIGRGHQLKNDLSEVVHDIKALRTFC